jgi:hypothetical protein
VIDSHAPLGHDFFEIAVGDRAADIEEDREENQILGEWAPLNEIILHPPQCLRSLRPAILQHTSVKNQSSRQNPSGTEKRGGGHIPAGPLLR